MDYRISQGRLLEFEDQLQSTQVDAVYLIGMA